jgi:hypothetical protein
LAEVGYDLCRGHFVARKPVKKDERIKQAPFQTGSGQTVLIRNKPGLKALVAILRDPPRSGTENIYKIYAESFRGADHLRRILEEAQTIVSDALAAVPVPERGKGRAS